MARTALNDAVLACLVTIAVRILDNIIGLSVKDLADAFYVQDALWLRGRRGVDAILPNHFMTAQGLASGDHMVMQGIVQKFIDSSI